jgi:hypothetical protein
VSEFKVALTPPIPIVAEIVAPLETDIPVVEEITEPAPPPPPLPPNPPPPPPPTAKVRIEFISVGIVIDDVPAVKRTMHVPSTVVESSSVKLEVSVPSIVQLPDVTSTADALCRIMNLGRPKVKIERKITVTNERDMRRRRDVVVTDIVLPLHGFNCVLRRFR